MSKYVFKHKIGDKFNSLTIISNPFVKKSKKGKNLRYISVVCDCGNKIDISVYTLGIKKYCLNPIHKLKHGLTYHKIYRLLVAMKSRCYNKNHKGYKNYGGRGITICEEWLNDIVCFYDFCINNGWKEGLDIDRIDNNMGYFPQNCRFVTKNENRNNRNCTLYAEYNGERKLLKEWSLILNIDYNLLRKHIVDFNKSISDMIKNPPKKTNNNKLLEINGEFNTLSNWCKVYNVDIKTVWARINKYKMPLYIALTHKKFQKSIKNEA